MCTTKHCTWTSVTFTRRSTTVIIRLMHAMYIGFDPLVRDASNRQSKAHRPAAWFP